MCHDFILLSPSSHPLALLIFIQKEGKKVPVNKDGVKEGTNTPGEKDEEKPPADGGTEKVAVLCAC